MKKFKKLLAGLLAGAMMLGSMSATAFAAQTTTPATIDTAKTGSLTIHKYEYNGNGGTAGTGSETDTVPEGAKPLEGAGFTIYKVAGVDDLTDYYNTNPTDLPDVNTYVTDGKINSAYADKKVGDEVKTGSNGIAEFKPLDLGFYVVIETTTPDKVTTPAKPFLVSIPMTTVDGADWLYDVHVFPKNKTTYGGVTLEKKGNNTTALSGVTFVLQKQNGSSWTNVTTKDSDGTALTLVTDKSGQINVDGLSQGTYRFIETDRGSNAGYIMDGATTYEFVVGADGKITYGGKTENNITIPVNNEKPDMTKTVKDRTSDNWKQDADYNVGDLVPYKITVDVPSNITSLKYFTLTDTPTNLTDDVNSVKIKDGNTEISTEAYVVAKNGNGFTITFTPDKMNDYAGKQLVITYNAELLSTAVTTTDGNPNTAKLEYSNKILPGQDDADNPNTPENPDEKPGKDSIEDTAIVYTFQVKIDKRANSATGEKLAGVSFDLYKEVTAGTKDAITGDTAKDTGLDTSKSWLKINTLTTGDDGTVSQRGLANGTYYLVETKTAEGYNLLKAPVKVTLSIEYTTKWNERWEWTTNSDGTKTLVKHTRTSEKAEFKENNETSDGTHTETIINKTGFTLPTTGGMGTITITVLGIALAFAGVLIIGASRKKTTK